MFDGHNPYLVALSVVVAILGGYTGFGLAARVRGTPGLVRRLLLGGAAMFLAVGIWTMHFVGMLAAPLPPEAVHLVLPTFISFLICALVVGVSLFFVSIGEPSELRIGASALLLGGGIVSMHYVGIHGLAGGVAIEHRHGMVLLAVLIAVVTAYGGLHAFLARQGGRRLALSAVAFGVAVSGMHYTAMYGMKVTAAPATATEVTGAVASAEALAMIVALLCFVLAAGFLLFLVPEPRRHQVAAATADHWPDAAIDAPPPAQRAPPRAASGPLGGIGMPSPPLAPRLPVEAADGTLFIDVEDVRSIKADAHYTLVHDGERERMCPWSISEAEIQLDPARFVRVHRSHIVSLPHVRFMRREGDGAVVEMDGGTPHFVPVSRARIAELRVRLGLGTRRTAGR